MARGLKSDIISSDSNDSPSEQDRSSENSDFDIQVQKWKAIQEWFEANDIKLGYPEEIE